MEFGKGGDMYLLRRDSLGYMWFGTVSLSFYRDGLNSWALLSSTVKLRLSVVRLRVYQYWRWGSRRDHRKLQHGANRFIDLSRLPMVPIHWDTVDSAHEILLLQEAGQNYGTHLYSQPDAFSLYHLSFPTSGCTFPLLPLKPPAARQFKASSVPRSQ